jgi:hypothetical protein
VKFADGVIANVAAATFAVATPRFVLTIEIANGYGPIAASPVFVKVLPPGRNAIAVSQ